MVSFAWFKNKIMPSIRVVERQMDGCMAHYCSREDYGTVIGHDERSLYGSGEKLSHYWLIKWDEEAGREPEWYPACFFSWQQSDGTHVRSC